MLWIIQDNLFNEAGYVRFVDALDRLAIPYLTVKIIPFTNRILPADFDSMVDDVDTAKEPEIDITQKIMAFGATSLTRVAKARGWLPGTYLNENFDFNVWRHEFGAENILNGDAIVGPVHSMVNTFDDHWNFVRPVHDTKSFSGMVRSCYDLQEWLQYIGQIEPEEFSPLHRDTEILICSAKDIQSEFRLFVVDGKIVTASQYKVGNRVIANEGAEEFVLDFAAEMVAKWQPAKAFVIDIAVTEYGPKVIEINNINSAGFYAADAQKIIMAIEELESEQ